VRVEVQLFATLAAHLPPGSRGGVAVLDVPDGTTVADLCRRLGIPGDLARVALVNGEEAEGRRPLGPADVVAVFPPLVGGGA
jgi:molybdopterin converting factor small subunit